MDEIPYVGDGLKKKIKELIEQGKMTKLDKIELNPKLKAFKEFLSIDGVGSGTAAKLYANGIKSIAQLKEEIKKKPSLLTFK